ncbi:MAG: serine/threonine protein kinase [Bacteroidetes bacterium]|nr:serine/threonine protein kinase [Bacteroidota bacterium]
MAGNQTWDRAFAIFDMVADSEESERIRVLDDVCAGDPVLRGQVESMLRAESEGSDFLNEKARDTVFTSLASVVPDALDPAVGRTVSRYTIRRRIGSGGMGAVYLADRADIGGQVALKLVRAELADPSRRIRFVQEQQILARLQHRNIARLYDAGAADDGTAFIAMEYVDGLDIVSYCDTRRLDVPARLQLIEQVCSAIQHAHENFVVHRDLKPSNIFVDTEGNVKLLDFGIAKLVDEQESGVETHTGRRLATPAYASPEQVAGAPILASSDVYSIGVVLHELLCGARPGHQSGTDPVHITTSLDSIDRSAADRIAAARNTTLDRLTRTLKGDLDTICLKALQPDPARRYNSAEAFVDDIRRYLNDEPVAARPDSPWYRLRKFVVRHRVASIATVAVVAAVIGFIGLTLRYQGQLQVERDRAEEEALLAEEVTSFILNAFSAADPRFSFDTEASIGSVLDKAELSAFESLDQDSRVRGRMLVSLASIRNALGDYNHFKILLDSAAATFGHPDSPDDIADYRFQLELGNYYDRIDDYEQALRHLEHARTVAEQENNWKGLGTSLSYQAATYSRLGRFAVADSLYRAAADAYRRVLEPDNRNFANLDFHRADMLLQLRRLPEADSLGRSALAGLTRGGGRKHWSLGPVYRVNAGIAMQRGDYDRADSLLKADIALWQGLKPAIPVRDQAKALQQYAALLLEREQFQSGVDTLRRVLDLSVSLDGEDTRANAVILNQISMGYIGINRFEDALNAIERALTINRRLLPADHTGITANLYNRGKILAELGRHEDALAQFQEVAVRDSLRFGDRHPEVAIDRLQVAAELITLGRDDPAEITLNSVDSVLNDRLDPPHRRLAEVQEQRGRLAALRSDCETAGRHYSAALAQFTELSGESARSSTRVKALADKCR